MMTCKAICFITVKWTTTISQNGSIPELPKVNIADLDIVLNHKTNTLNIFNESVM
jgi:hypothetical protein